MGPINTYFRGPNFATYHHNDKTSYPNPSLGDKEYLLSVYLVSEIRRSCVVKDTESPSSPVISNKSGDARRSDDTAHFLDVDHIFWRWR